VKPVRFLGDSLKSIRAFPADVRRDVGFQLEALQLGEQPADLKKSRATPKHDIEIARDRYAQLKRRQP